MSCRLLSVGALGCLSLFLHPSQPVGLAKKSHRLGETGRGLDGRRGVGGAGIPSILSRRVVGGFTVGASIGP
jgi:hypothetical protein